MPSLVIPPGQARRLYGAAYLRPSFRYPAASRYHRDSGSIQRASQGRFMICGASEEYDMAGSRRGRRRGAGGRWCGPVQSMTVSSSMLGLGCPGGQRARESPIGEMARLGTGASERDSKLGRCPRRQQQRKELPSAHSTPIDSPHPAHSARLLSPYTYTHTAPLLLLRSSLPHPPPRLHGADSVSRAFPLERGAFVWWCRRAGNKDEARIC